jgi:hypothetical protein
MRRAIEEVDVGQEIRIRYGTSTPRPRPEIRGDRLIRNVAAISRDCRTTTGGIGRCTRRRDADERNRPEGHLVQIDVWFLVAIARYEIASVRHKGHVATVRAHHGRVAGPACGPTAHSFADQRRDSTVRVTKIHVGDGVGIVGSESSRRDEREPVTVVARARRVTGADVGLRAVGIHADAGDRRVVETPLKDIGVLLIRIRS